MGLAASFNESSFSRWLNGPTGRMFRVVAGMTFLIVGVAFHDEWWGIASIVWSFFPLTAGVFDVCYISISLGGPFRGEVIREQQW